MTSPTMTPAPEPGLGVKPRSVAQAKADLLGWAQERERNAKPMLPSAGLVIGGGIAVLAGGLILSRLLGPRAVSSKSNEPPAPMGARVIGVLIAARIARWLLPLALSVGRAYLTPKSRPK